MLTADLLRARYRNGEVRPIYLDPADPQQIDLAEQLVAIFRAHVGKTRGALEEALADLVGEATDFVLHRGFAKLLFDRSDFAVDSPIDPVELRRHVFEHTVPVHPVAREEGDRVHSVTRAQVLGEVAAKLGLAPEAVERGLYADLEREHVLRSIDAPEPKALLHRYNLALAQAVLYRATALEVKLTPGDPARYRQLFRYVKFYRLMHSARGSRGMGYTLTLDGPASLFTQSTRYGLQMAEFLPALLLCDGWSLEATLEWGLQRKTAKFLLEAGSGLVSHYPDKGVYVTEEESHFVQRFAAAKTEWKLDKRPELYDLDGRGVLIPDFVLRHERDGREALLEIVGFWRKSSLEPRLALLREAGPKNLILALSNKLRVSDDELAEVPGAVVSFKDVIPVKEVLAQAERVGAVPAGASLRGGDAPSKAAAKKKPKGATVPSSAKVEEAPAPSEPAAAGAESKAKSKKPAKETKAGARAAKVPTEGG